MKEELSPIVGELVNRFGISAAVAVRELREGGFEFGYRSRRRFHGASIVKNAILAEALRRVCRGELDRFARKTVSGEDRADGGVLCEMCGGVEVTVQDLMRLMIVVSDNTASNMMLDILGMDAVNAFIAAAGLEDTAIVKKFMAPPPAPHVFNYTTALDTVCLLEGIYRRRTLPEAAAAEFFEILKRQHYVEKIPRYISSSVQVANKTGEISDARHDCAVVFHSERPYAVAVFTDGLSDTAAADDFIAQLSLEVFRFFNLS